MALANPMLDVMCSYFSISLVAQNIIWLHKKQPCGAVQMKDQDWSQRRLLKTKPKPYNLR